MDQKGKQMLIEDKTCLLEKLKDISGKLYIVGAGKFGIVFGTWLEKNNIDFLGYIDQLKEGVVYGKPIYKDIDEKMKEAFFLISSSIYRKELTDNLVSQGVNTEKIIALSGSTIQYEVYEEMSNWRSYTERNKKFYNCHSDRKRCFVIGNGPSLTIEDLNKLKNEITFACNSIYAVYDKTSWRPTYYCAWDSLFCDEMMSDKKDLKKIMDGCEAAFTSVAGKGFQFRDDEEFQNLYYVSSIDETDPDTQLPKFSDDCSKTVYASGTVAYLMLQLAVYMGFKEIYLLGMDCSFSHECYRNGEMRVNETQNHMKEIEDEEDNLKPEMKKRYGTSFIAYMDLQMDGFAVAKRYMESQGRKIYNATRGGKLEVYERVEFDRLLCKEEIET